MLGKEQGKGIVGEFEIDTYTQLYLKRIPRFRPVGRRRPGLWGPRSRGSDPGCEISDHDR